MNKSDAIKYSLSLANAFEDRPFPDDYSSVVMKHTDNKKWFALMMEVKGEIYLNVKTNPEYSELLRKTYDYIIPAYHMNKEHWNTIILDERSDSSLVEELIKQSYELTKNNIHKRKINKKGKSRRML